MSPSDPNEPGAGDRPSADASPRLGFEEKAGYAILTTIFVTPILVVLAVVGLLVWLLVEPFGRSFDRVDAESVSPDRGVILRVVHRDTGMGFGSGEEWGEIVLERPRRFFGPERKTLWQFGLTGRADTRARVAWRDPSHVVVTFSAETAVATTTVSALGITADIVREPPPRVAPTEAR